MTVGDALKASGIDSREARILLAEASGFSQAAIVASQERALASEVEDRFRQFIEKRKAGEPVAYIVGHKEFYGLDLAVNPAVLIPRPETELLVDLALKRPFRSALDLGTGSGAVALALKKHRPNAQVVGVEASAAALVVAQRNATRLDLEVDFRHGLWFEPLAGRRFDLIVANPPYVAEGDPHLPDLRFEPRTALVSGADGLRAIRQIAGAAAGHLETGGWLLLEHGLGQDAAVREILRA
ncbi:peptide chain release factor N(5)-glutamine methyltransferase, partial [Phenylobacterium sp.]|uniref:peptide chain release factor N(5)-glutamine methyltransferase n=1 Tax=Phenylobacterium sp. TaxID=1871053 RepID=UPI002F40DE7C